MLAMAHREATGTPVEQYVNGPTDLATRNFSKDHLLIVFDDVAGSGQSLEDSVADIRRKNFPGKVIASPMVSTEQAKKLFSRISKTNGGVIYEPSSMSRALRESLFYKSLDTEQQAFLEKLIDDDGYAGNALSISFPYMSPDNNNSLFGWIFAQFFITNKNQLASKSKPYNYPTLQDSSRP